MILWSLVQDAIVKAWSRVRVFLLQKWDAEMASIQRLQDAQGVTRGEWRLSLLFEKCLKHYYHTLFWFNSQYKNSYHNAEYYTKYANKKNL